MANSLVSFLERRKKSAVKASALLQKSEEHSEAEPEDKKSEEEPEAQSEHDNEWRVSSDESDDPAKQSSTFGPNLVKVVQVLDNGELDELSKETQEKKTQQVWNKVEESEEEAEPEPAKPKLWVPKYKETQNLLNSRNDVDLAESVKMFNKNESLVSKKKKKSKPKSLQELEDEDDDFALVKLKFNVFSLLDSKYSEFKSEKYSMVDDLVKSKYLNRVVSQS
ncbi:hypothetical protein MACK_002086 [Theileria orientalis]|uniref:Uncharacterized protein n=1 Tax=Theileria orientalis TaxID=68886 RepID=A0A976QV33_THEOR|nr:hypothetical protein MACK_002086 [Theileria orientalis]